MATVVTQPNSTVESGAPDPGLAPWRPIAWYAAALFPLVFGAPWLFLVAGQDFPVPFSSLSGLILASLLISVSITDLIWRRIPNWATYTTVIWVGILHSIVAIAPETTLTLPVLGGERTATLQAWLTGVAPDMGMAGFLLGSLVVLALWWVFDSGGGDMKLIAAMGTIVGIDRILSVFATGMIVAAVGAACFIVWVAGPAGFVDKRLMDKKTPMAPFFALGAFLALLW